MIRISEGVKDILNEAERTAPVVEEAAPQEDRIDTRPIVMAKGLMGVRRAGTSKVVGIEVQTSWTFWATLKRLPFIAVWFLSAFLSKRITPLQFGARMGHCRTCSQRLVTLTVKRGRVKEKSYCRACACPRWHFSRLEVKNWMSKWFCPLKNHDGNYPDDLLIKHIIKHGYADEDQLKPTIGCGSRCGGR